MRAAQFKHSMCSVARFGQVFLNDLIFDENTDWVSVIKQIGQLKDLNIYFYDSLIGSVAVKMEIGHKKNYPIALVGHTEAGAVETYLLINCPAIVYYILYNCILIAGRHDITDTLKTVIRQRARHINQMTPLNTFYREWFVRKVMENV